MAKVSSEFQQGGQGMRRYRLLIFICFAAGCIAGCGFQKEILLTGRTMGTTYHIKVVAGYLTHTSRLQNKIDQRLKQINNSMSVFIQDSEISRFNALNQAGKPVRVSDDFYGVMIMARELFRLTDGAWDGTVGPLINLWGFGDAGRQGGIPEKEKIFALKADVGFDLIEMDGENLLSKKNPAVRLNLSSIAKGFAVDEVEAVIKSQGIENCLVEIGGEVKASGRKLDGTRWKVGVNTPGKNSPLNQVYEALGLENKALATSGDYRNYFEKNGITYSHIIDPRTGSPVADTVVSVSVLSDSCAFADGLATAVMVMGVEKGLDLVNALTGVECLIVVREAEGLLTDHVSNGFRHYLLSL